MSADASDAGSPPPRGATGRGPGAPAGRDRGWAFPVRVAPGGGVALAEGEAAVHRALEVIVRTRPGERVMLPRFGCAAGTLLFRPLTPAVLDSIAWHVDRAVRAFEDRVAVESVRAARDPGSPGAVAVEVRYRAGRDGAGGRASVRLSAAPLPPPRAREGDR